MGAQRRRPSYSSSSQSSDSRSRSRAPRKSRRDSSGKQKTVRSSKSPVKQSADSVIRNPAPPTSSGFSLGAAPAVAAKASNPKVGASGIDFASVRKLKQEIEEKKQKEEEDKATALQDLITARHAHDAAQETDSAKEAREREYFKGSMGDTCGPDNRFVVQEDIGRGVFSSVYRCRDVSTKNTEYAIKFTRSNSKLRRATEREIQLLGYLCTESMEQDPEGARHILGLVFFEGFEHEGHLAIVYQLMKCDLRVALTKYTQGNGFPLLPTVRSLSKQIFLALRALQRSKVIHSDVKPDNLLLGLDRETVKLSDFGSAIMVNERVRTDYMQPRHYRAPEIILGQTYGTQIDVWSAGATFFELATGQCLFEGRRNNDMIHEMLKVCGPFSIAFATDGHFAKRHFKENGDFMNGQGDYAINSKNPAILPMSSFKGPLRSLEKLLDEKRKEVPKGLSAERHQRAVTSFCDLLRKCLLPDPGKRVVPDIALGHRFFEKGA